MSETPDELRAPLNALVAKATKGPWETYFTVHGDPYIIEGGKPFPQYILATIATSPDDYGRANTQLIVALVNAWPAIDALLARLPTAEADADRLAEAMRNTVEEFYGEDGHTYNPDETECLRLHDEAVARREQP